MVGMFRASTDENWMDDEDNDFHAERFSCQSPVGLTMGKLVLWAQELSERFGTNTVLTALDVDEDNPSIEIDRNSE